jgi:hypothetical protein
MAGELSIDSLKDIKKADYIKAFKVKAQWKKAKAVVLFIDYKLDGKKTTLAVPFRKVSDMKLEMKRIKKDKLHPMKKSVGGLFSLENEGEEGIKAKIEIVHGGAKPELLQIKAEDLFGRINAQLEVLIAANAELEPESELAAENEEKDDAGTPIAEIENSIKELNGLLNEHITKIIAAIKDKKPKEEYLAILEDISDKIKDLKESFENATDAVKEKLKANVDKILSFVSKIAEIKKALEILLKKGETPTLPDNVKKIIETLVAKIKEAKAVKKDPKKFNDIAKLVKKSFEALEIALGLINKELAEKLKQSKVYQFIEDFIDSLADEDEAETTVPQINEAEKKEYEGTIKELESLFSSVGIQF